MPQEIESSNPRMIKKIVKWWKESNEKSPLDMPMLPDPSMHFDIESLQFQPILTYYLPMMRPGDYPLDSLNNE
jgi:hypothetical protein